MNESSDPTGSQAQHWRMLQRASQVAQVLRATLEVWRFWG